MNDAALMPRPLALAQWALALTPALCALVFVPALASPFIVPKASLMTACAALSLALMAFSSNRAPSIALRDPLVLTSFAGLAWLCLVTVFSPLRYMAMSSATLIASAVAIFYCSRRVIAGAEPLLFRSLAIAAALISVVALAQFAFGFDLPGLSGAAALQTGRMRVQGTLGNPNFVGGFLGACLPAILTLSSNILRRSLIVLNCAAILCTGSRAAALAAAAAVFIYISLGRSQRATSRAKGFGFAFLVLIACLVSLLVVARLNPRSARTALQGRTTIWRVALHRIHWLGTGLGTFSYTYLPAVGSSMRDGVAINPTFITPERHAQNDLVELVVETGPIGALLVGAVFILWFRHAIASRSEHARFAVATVAAILVSAMLDFPLHRAETVSLLAVAMAIPLATPRDLADAKQSRQLKLAIAAPLAAGLLIASVLPIVSSRLTRVGLEAENRGQFESASTSFARAAILWPDNTDAQFSSARALAQAGRYSEALAATARAKRFIAEPELYLLRARILESMNDYVSAEHEMQSAAQVFPFSTIPQAELDEIRANHRP